MIFFNFLLVKKYSLWFQRGIIRFGSRVDVWLPSTTTVQVIQGQTMIAGETILADLSAKMPEIT